MAITVNTSGGGGMEKQDANVQNKNIFFLSGYASNHKLLTIYYIR